MTIFLALLVLIIAGTVGINEVFNRGVRRQDKAIKQDSTPGADMESAVLWKPIKVGIRHPGRLTLKNGKLILFAGEEQIFSYPAAQVKVEYVTPEYGFNLYMGSEKYTLKLFSSVNMLGRTLLRTNKDYIEWAEAIKRAGGQ